MTAPDALSRRMRRRRRVPRRIGRLKRGAPVLAALALAGCNGAQSWLSPTGAEAETVSDLFWVMLAGGVVIWSGVMALAWYAARAPHDRHSGEQANRLIIWGGIAVPTLTLLTLALAGLLVLRAMAAAEPDLRLAAQGEQWWWRVAQTGPDGEPVPTPNELRLPVGATAEIRLTAAHVIHSFWAPTLGGKLDMIPGRENRLTLTPTRTGVYRGQCAEYCGEAHAQMAFPVVVMEPEAFRAWLARQAQPASPPSDARRRRGLDLFLSNGCGACHAIRGTRAEGRVGPDLTHFGSRLSIAAEALPMGVEEARRWIAAPEAVKPGARMPAYGMLPQEELTLIAEYLVGLK